MISLFSPCRRKQKLFENKYFILMLFIFSQTSLAVSQINFELQIGGSNFLGYSLNTSFDIPISKNKHHLIVPSIGVGALIPGIGETQSIIRYGINYQFKKFGIGSELAGFNASPFLSSNSSLGFIDVLVYPNVNYQWVFKSKLYIKLSAGAYFAFEKQYLTESKTLDFAGDIIPGGGISIGYKF